MQRSLRQIIGYSLGANDGALGKVSDFLFDEARWTIRYIVADTGTWLPGRRVLLSPKDVRSADWLKAVIYVNRTTDEIKNSPSLDADGPVSRQKETELSRYYGWPLYWMPAVSGLEAGEVLRAPIGSTDDSMPAPATGDPNLRSVKEVTGYYVVARDGQMGHLEDFIADDESWAIRYVIIDTVNWWPGRKVVLSPEWITAIRWDTRRVHFDLDKEAIKGAPEYNAAQPINREYEEVLYDYYGRPRYWGNR